MLLLSVAVEIGRPIPSPISVHLHYNESHPSPCSCRLGDHSACRRSDTPYAPWAGPDIERKGLGPDRHAGTDPSDLHAMARYSRTPRGWAFHRSSSIAFYFPGAFEAEERRESASPRADQQDDQAPAVARDRAAGRQHDLRDGAARRIPQALCPDASLHRLGPCRSSGVAGEPPHVPNQSSEASRRSSTKESPGESAGSNSTRGIEGGMSTGARFLPSTQASTVSAHSCSIWRR